MEMRQPTTDRVYRATVMVTAAAVVFYLFFQINKGGPFRQINPFGADPYDAIGSFAIQFALLIGVLTYSRALRMREDPLQAAKMALIYRGNLLVIAVILVTLASDSIAVLLHPMTSSWGNILLVELVLMFAFLLGSGIVFFAAFIGIARADLPNDLTPADGIDDLWTLVRVPVERLSVYLPPALVHWVVTFNSDRLFAHVAWLNPRAHPWRFAGALGLLVGLGLYLAQLQEGLPPSLGIALLLAGIFSTAELCATLLGFTILGGFLGLRPSLYKHSL
jgi:hypothetical protein